MSKRNNPKTRVHDRDIRCNRVYANTTKHIMSPEEYKEYLRVKKVLSKIILK